MEEFESQTERVEEQAHEHAHEARDPWISMVALSVAILAAFAAVAGMISGHNINEAMLEQMEANDKWGHYQANSIKAGGIENLAAQLQAMGKELPESRKAKQAKYEADKEKLKKEAETLEHEAAVLVHRHVIISYGVTMFQVGIAIAAISALTRRKPVWMLGLIFGCAGVAFLAYGLAASADHLAPRDKHAETESAHVSPESSPG